MIFQGDSYPGKPEVRYSVDNYLNDRRKVTIVIDGIDPMDQRTLTEMIALFCEKYIPNGRNGNG